MAMLHILCIFILTFLLPFAVFAPSVELFFTADELTDMGIHIES
jgi:hypothetical protein